MPGEAAGPQGTADSPGPHDECIDHGRYVALPALSPADGKSVKLWLRSIPNLSTSGGGGCMNVVVVLGGGGVLILMLVVQRSGKIIASGRVRR